MVNVTINGMKVSVLPGSLNMNPVENVPLAEKAPCALLS